MKPICTFLFSFFLISHINSQDPVLIAPVDIVVSCGFKFIENDLLDPSSTLFGSVVFDSTKRRNVITTDIVCHKMCEPNPKTGYPGDNPGNPGNLSAANKACFYYSSLFDTLHKDLLYGLVWGEDGLVINPLENKIKISIIDNRICHQGQILRVFSTPGPNNTEVKDTQNIWVIDCTLFSINPSDHGRSFVISGCSIPPPDSTQKPNLPIDSCSSISINYIDSISVRDPEYFYILYRQWVIIDYCQYDPNTIPVSGRWTYFDTIYVIDHIAPVNTILVQDCKTADSTGLGNIIITIDYKDNCTATDWIYCSYSIDLNNDGIGKYNGFDLKVGPLNLTEFKLGLRPLISDNAYSTNTDNPADASGKYPEGRHKVLFETKDGLGNTAKDSIYFTIFRSNKPKFECPNTDFVIPIVLSKTYVISIPDLLFFQQDNCSPYSDLKVSIDGDPNKIKDIINCFDYLENGNLDTLKRIYKVWIQDTLGNLTICSVGIHYNFQGNCDSSKTNYFSGHFYNLNNKEIENLDLEIKSPSLGELNFSTACANFFKISTNLLDSGYSFYAKRHDLLNNGIDVLDVMLLFRHILGIEFIENKLSAIAGDVNNNKSITTKDINDLVKQILRTVPNQQSESDNFWNFFNKTDTSIITANSKITDSVSHFIGVKIGDVNGNALSKCDEQRIKPNTCINLTHSPLNLQKGIKYLIPIFSSNYKNMFGLQASFQFNKDIIQLDTILPGQFVGMQYNLDFSLRKEGKFNFLYYMPLGFEESVPSNNGLFILKITALENYNGNDFLQVIDDPTYSIAYDKDENPLDICVNGISTQTNDVENDHFIIYPNPTNDKFYIKSESISTPVKICISNAAGQLICTKKISEINQKGILIDELTECNPGIYFISIQTKDQVKSEILVKI